MHAIATITYHFPAVPVLRLVQPITWQTRLRMAVERSGKKQSAIAHDADISPATLSRILNQRTKPSFEVVVRIARAAGENVGWLLEECGFALNHDERKQLRSVIQFLGDAIFTRVTDWRAESNATLANGADIPHFFVVRGARLAYEASGDSMIGAGIADRDLVFVKPTRNVREANGRIVVCRLDAAEYLKVLDVRAGRMRLLSRNERYSAIDVNEDRFELIGIVVGRTGTLG